MARSVNVYAASVGARFGQQPENFGDNLMADLLEGLFSLRVNYATLGSAELLGVGSILDSYFRRKKGKVHLLSRRPWRTLHVWGSGFMDENSAALWPQKLQYHATRGPLTAVRVGQRQLPLGDPALLLPMIWPSKPIKRFAVGVIPHFATLPLFRSRYESNLPSGWVIIDLLQKPKEVCATISASDVVVSSSLHGLIVADAYGVPSQRIAPENAIKGDGFKFKDYEEQRGTAFSSPREFREVLSEGIKVDEFTVAKPSSELLDRLLLSFPFR
ncbi:MAG: polysaccharide pyruvyl transferase family protein [Ensifer alkalisoli]|nr:polysaccharide pyruvyl transferase family protein [Sinorhizobium alkalisoli]